MSGLDTEYNIKEKEFLDKIEKDNFFICRLCGHDKYVKNYHDEHYFCMNCGVHFSNTKNFTLPDVKFKRISNKARIPFRATKGSVGFDFYTAEEICLWPNKPELVSTDLAVELPSNTEMQIRGRSGFSRMGIMIANGVGTIDSDYRGIIKIMLINQRPECFNVKIGQRVAQGLITTKLPYKFMEVNELNDTERGSGGFGSTGTM